MKIKEVKIIKNIIIAVILFIVIMAVLVCQCVLAIFVGVGMSQENRAETFLMTSQSPDGKYVLDAYKTEPGATVDFSIKVYLINGEKRELIYNAYHEYQVSIIWIDNNNVSINGKVLNLSVGEKYDWRA